MNVLNLFRSTNRECMRGESPDPVVTWHTTKNTQRTNAPQDVTTRTRLIPNDLLASLPLSFPHPPFPPPPQRRVFTILAHSFALIVWYIVSRTGSAHDIYWNHREMMGKPSPVNKLTGMWSFWNCCKNDWQIIPNSSANSTDMAYNMYWVIAHANLDQWGGVNSTPHLACITRNFFSRVAEAHQLHFLCVLSTNIVIVSRASHVSHLAWYTSVFYTQHSDLFLFAFPSEPDQHLRPAKTLVWAFCRTVSAHRLWAQRSGRSKYRGYIEPWDVRHQWRRDNQDQHSAHETRHLTSECARSLLVSSCCSSSSLIAHHIAWLKGLTGSSVFALISSMHEVSVTLRLWALHSMQLPTLLILLQFPVAPTALLLPRGYVVTLCTPPNRRWGQLTSPTPSQINYLINLREKRAGYASNWTEEKELVLQEDRGEEFKKLKNWKVMPYRSGKSETVESIWTFFSGERKSNLQWVSIVVEIAGTTK